MNRLIVIRFQIENIAKDYASVGSFLRKYKDQDIFTKDELQRVSRAQITKLESIYTLNSADYKAINPSSVNKLHTYLQQYNLCFFIEIDAKNTDSFALTNFQYLYLLMERFSKFNIYCLVRTSKDSRLYFRLSHYFALLSTNSEFCPPTLRGNAFYDRIYFDQQDRLIRLQRKGIGGLTVFPPLIPICKETIDTIFSPVKLSDEDFAYMLQKHSSTPKEAPFRLIDGCKNLLSILFHDFPILKTDDFLRQVLAKMDLFTFFMFCYAIADKSMFTRMSPDQVARELRGYAARLASYSTGLQQVMENIVNHAEAGIGALSLKRYDATTFSDFLKSRDIAIPLKQSHKYLVFEISDYSADEKNGNIAHTFRRNLPPEFQSMFQNIAPVDFFVSKDSETEIRRPREIADAWQTYRAEGENFTKHFGLRIFKQITADAGGIFFMESHSTRYEQALERYVSCGTSSAYQLGQTVIPGTAYTVCLPLSTLHRAQDNSIDNHNINNNILKYIEFSHREVPIQVASHRSSQEEKQRLIADVAEQLSAALTRQGEKEACQCNVQIVAEVATGEIWCKALLLSLLRADPRSRFFALYNCTPVFIDQFKDTMKVFFNGTKNCNPLIDHLIQVSLFRDGEINSLIIFPGSLEKTWYANEQSCRAKGVPNLLDWPKPAAKVENLEIAPLEVICRPEQEGGAEPGQGLTLFEHYAYQKLISDIQGQELGCKIEHTHLRLGSTIHISTFYEAELLFSNSLFYSRFNFLLMKALLPQLVVLPTEIDRIVLYGYSAYSELLLFGLQTQLQKWAEGMGRSLTVEYIILEREAERRGFDHIDHIRSSSESLIDHLKQSDHTRYVIIVPVNSTLKTHNKMVSLLEQTAEISLKRGEAGNLIGNFSLITVGPKNLKTDYWERNPSERSITPSLETLPQSKYFIYLNADYHEADTCSLCFPENPLEEIPLIEVNAASTIPNQAFELNAGMPPLKLFTYDDIVREQEQLDCLAPVVNYGHIERGENHFLYYFELERLLQQQRLAIAKEVRAFRDKELSDLGDYNIIFCPMHFSNAGFVELINNEVFSGSALVIRLDVDKEFRSNTRAKFSYLYTLIDNLEQAGRNTVIRVYFLDDSIISGRTFFRAKSLVTSLFNNDKRLSKVSVRIFDGIFLLLNRNSDSSMKAYCTDFSGDSHTKCFVFRNVRISSIRTHGDSCVICNLYHEAEHMREMSSTRLLYNRWDRKRDCFQVRTLEKHKERCAKQLVKADSCLEKRAYWRMLTTHIAGTALAGAARCDKRDAFQAILALLTVDLEGRKKDLTQAREFFFSYIKVLSRPFLIFNKAVKEAILDLILILIEHYVYEYNVNTIIETLKDSEEKQYLYEFLSELNRLCEDIKDIITSDAQVDYLKLLMSQLTELKSNYTLRPKNMEAILEKSKKMIGDEKGDEKWDFYSFYLMQIKRLTTISSDTSKSLWLTREICANYSKSGNSPIPKFIELVILENTRVLFDAVSKLTAKLLSEQLQEGERKKGSNWHGLVKDYLEELRSTRREELKQAEQKKPEGTDAQKILAYCRHLAERHDMEDSRNCSYQEHSEPEEVAKAFFARLRILAPSNDNKMKNTHNILSRILDNVFSEDKYLYDNLKKLMRIWGYSDSDGITKEGEQLLRALVALWLHIELNFSEKAEIDSGVGADASDVGREAASKVLKKMSVPEIYSFLAELLRYVLDADQLAIVTEVEAKHNLWKRRIALEFAEFAQAIDGVDPIHSENEGDYIEYLILTDGKPYTGNDDKPGETNYHVDKSIVQTLRNYEQSDQEGQKAGYLLMEQDDRAQFVLSLSNSGKQKIYLYASFYGQDRLYRLRRISCGLMFFPKLVGTVFDKKGNRFLQELVRERYALSIQQRAKAHSHTQNDELLQYYNSAYFRPDLKNNISSHHEDAQNHQSWDRMDGDVLCLVSDQVISDTYRSSLLEDFYLPRRGVSSTRLKESLKGIWSDDGNSLTLTLKPAGKNAGYNRGNKSVKLRLLFPTEDVLRDKFPACTGDKAVYPIRKEDTVFYIDSTQGNMHIPLFLLALARNAIKKTEFTSDMIDVYLMKTSSGDLRIANEVTLDQIDDLEATREKHLENPPANVEDGISLWSVSRYVQAIVASLLDESLEELKKLSKDDPNFRQNVQQFKRIYSILTSPDYTVRIASIPVGESKVDSREKKMYFCIDLPLLEEKFSRLGIRTKRK